MAFKTHKTKKSKRKRGTTNYHGARKKWKSSGHWGGTGMSGTGKRADHKKSLIIKLYGSGYFGKQGITSRSSAKDRRKQINLGDIQKNFNAMMKKHGKDGKLILKGYKILGEGEINEKLTIKAKAFSESAKKKIEKAGGEAIVSVQEGAEDKKSAEENKVAEKKGEKIKITKAKKIKEK